MVWALLILMLAFGLGVLTAYHSKLTYSFIVAAIPIIWILMRPITVVGAGASGASGRGNPFAVYMDGFAMLPGWLQVSVILFPVFLIAGRLSAWIFRVSSGQEYESETQTRRGAEQPLPVEQTWQGIIAAKKKEQIRPQTERYSHSNRAGKTFGRR